MIRITTLAAVSVLTLSACGDAADEPASAPPAAPAAPEAPASPTTPAAPRVVSLDPEGLRLVDRQSGSTASIAFGQPSAQVVALVSASLGGAPGRWSSPHGTA
jgi:ABC-type Fe3+-hydroxamate transport system substrate-binding protein